MYLKNVKVGQFNIVGSHGKKIRKGALESYFKKNKHRVINIYADKKYIGFAFDFELKDNFVICSLDIEPKFEKAINGHYPAITYIIDHKNIRKKNGFEEIVKIHDIENLVIAAANVNNMIPPIKTI